MGQPGRAVAWDGANMSHRPPSPAKGPRPSPWRRGSRGARRAGSTPRCRGVGCRGWPCPCPQARAHAAMPGPGCTRWGRFVGFPPKMPAVLLAPRELRAEGMSVGTARRGPQGSPHPESSPNLGLCRGLIKQQRLLIASDDSERQLAAGTSLHAVTPGHGQRHRGMWWPWGNRAWGGRGISVPCRF